MNINQSAKPFLPGYLKDAVYYFRILKDEGYLTILFAIKLKSFQNVIFVSSTRLLLDYMYLVVVMKMLQQLTCTSESGDVTTPRLYDTINPVHLRHRVAAVPRG